MNDSLIFILKVSFYHRKRKQKPLPQMKRVKTRKRLAERMLCLLSDLCQFVKMRSIDLNMNSETQSNINGCFESIICHFASHWIYWWFKPTFIRVQEVFAKFPKPLLSRIFSPQTSPCCIVVITKNVWIRLCRKNSSSQTIYPQ